MARDRLPPSANLSPNDSDPDDEDEEEDIEEDEEQVDADVVNQKSAEADSDSDSEEEEDEAEEGDKAEEEAYGEEESSEKTASPAGGLDYGSDADSDKTMPSPCASDFVVKQNSETKKRLAESEPVKEKSEAKKLKKEKKNETRVAAAAEENAVAEDKAKRSLGLRIWGPEDEIMILTGMMDYKEKTGFDFNSNLDAFYQFLKGRLNAVVDKSQLVNKIRKLKEKYRDNAAKEANGEAPVFLKSHEADVYEHSKNVWGGKAVARSKPKSKKEKEVVPEMPPKSKKEKEAVTQMPPKSKKEKEVVTEMPPKSKKEKEVVTEMPVLEVESVLALPVPELEVSKKEVNGGSAKAASRVRKVEKKPKVVQKMEFVEADVEMKEKDTVIPMPVMVDGLVYEKGLELVDKCKVDALNEKWTKYQLDAAELYVRRLDLIKEQTELILDALKANT